MKKAQIAIIGRTNVGKSTLFNKLIEKRLSIVTDIPNTTRDRIYGKVLWRGTTLEIVDTGGMDINDKNEEEKEILFQAEKAIKESELILFVVDGKDGLMPFDFEIAKILRKENKKVILVINKTEKIKDEYTSEFSSLGFTDSICISALTGKNVGDMLDLAMSKITINKKLDEEKPEIKIAIIGKPNVGKSSLLNAILNEEKSIVSPKPHTTRESIDAIFKYKDKNFLIIDTAGIRKKSKVSSYIEKASIHQSFKNIDESDIVFFMIDVLDEIGSQDKKLLTYIAEKKKGLIILVNKWDLIENKSQQAINEYKKYLKNSIKSVSWAPVMFISAKDKIRVYKTLDMATKVFENQNRVIDNNTLSETISLIMNKQKPHLNRKHKILKIRNPIQISTNPPTFSLEIPKKEILQDSYRNFIENELRKLFDFTGTPIIITTRNKEN